MNMTRNTRNKKQNEKNEKNEKKGEPRQTELNLTKSTKSTKLPGYLPKRVINIKNITPDELIFAYEWAQNHKRPDLALLNAGITTPGDTKQTVDILVQEYTTNTQVLEAFKESMFNKLEALQITENKIDAHLSVIAHTDIGLSKDQNGNIIPLERMPWEMRFCVQEYEEKMFYPKDATPFKRTKVKCYNRMEALKALRANKKEDKAIAQSIVHNNGDTFIQNNIGVLTNNIQSGNTYNSEIKHTLNLSLLNTEELDILMKAIGRQIPEQVQNVEDWVNQVKQEELV